MATQLNPWWGRATESIGARTGLPSPGSPATSAEMWSRGLLGFATLASLALLVHPWYEPVNDAALYISTARSIAAGEGYQYLGIPFTVRPPGFSLLIAPIITFAEGNFFALNLFVSLLGVTTVFLLFFHQRSKLGWPLALLTALLVWLNPAFQRLCNTVLSDVPGAAALLACLLVARWSDRRPSVRRDVVLGLVIGLSAYVRVANLLLVGAIVLARMLRGDVDRSELKRSAMRVGLFAFVACIAIAPWFIRNQLEIPPPPADQTRLYSYATAMFHVDPGDPASPRFTADEIIERVELRARQIAAVLGGRLQTRVRFSTDDPASAKREEQAWRLVDLSNLYALALVAALFVQAIYWRDEACIYAISLLVFFLLYFGFQDRLLLPVYLIAFPAAVALLSSAATRVAGMRAGNFLTGVVLAALIVHDFAPREDWKHTEWKYRNMIATASAINLNVDPDARLATVTGFHLTALTGRPVYSLHRAVRRTLSGRAIEPIIDKYRLDTVVLESKSFERPLIEEYLRESYGAPRSAGNALIWSVRPKTGS